MITEQKSIAQQPQGWQQLIQRFPTARLLWDTPAGNGHMRAYSITGVVVLIHDYGQGGSDGWTAYIDPFTGLNAEDTYNAIAGHLDLEREAGR